MRKHRTVYGAPASNVARRVELSRQGDNSAVIQQGHRSFCPLACSCYFINRFMRPDPKGGSPCTRKKIREVTQKPIGSNHSKLRKIIRDSDIPVAVNNPAPKITGVAQCRGKRPPFNAKLCQSVREFLRPHGKADSTKGSIGRLLWGYVNNRMGGLEKAAERLNLILILSSKMQGNFGRATASPHDRPVCGNKSAPIRRLLSEHIESAMIYRALDAGLGPATHRVAAPCHETSNSSTTDSKHVPNNGSAFAFTVFAHHVFSLLWGKSWHSVPVCRR